MGTLIDSSVLVAIERTSLSLETLLEEHADEPVALASITASELLHGVHRAGSAARRLTREAYVEQVLAVVPVLPFDVVAARVHARLWAQLAAKGESVGAHDLLIGATALAVGYGVATHDLRSFSRIPGLNVVNW
jgi:tRNA(fMet)-specific endonuclease VapC